MDPTFEQNISPMDLRLYTLSKKNQFVKKYEKFGMHCPTTYRKKQFNRIKPSCNFNCYSLALEQVQERKIYKTKNVNPFSSSKTEY